MNRFICVAGLLVSLTVQAAGQVPGTISYQGLLVDDKGAPINGPVDLTVSLYDEATRGNLVWTRAYKALPVTNGIVDVLLEDGTPKLAMVPFDKPYWVQMQMGMTLMTPRTPLTSVPYAMGLRHVSLTPQGDVVVPSGYLKADSLVYNSPKTSYASIPAAAFKPAETEAGVYYKADNLYAAYTTLGGSFLMAPLQLPHGAMVTGFSCWLFDVDATYDMQCNFLRFDPSTEGSTTFISHATSGSSGKQFLTGPADPALRINNLDYSYLVMVGVPIVYDWPLTNHRVFQVVVEYTLPGAP